MPATSNSETNDAAIIPALFDAFVATGMARPTLPAGRRADVEHLLTLLMADPGRLAKYAAALKAERTQRGTKVRDRLFALADLDIPDQLIARQGFAPVTDEQLADLAISPEGLLALKQFLDQPEVELGDWFTAAVLDGDPPAADDVLDSARALEIYERLRQQGALGNLPPLTQPRSTPASQHSSTWNKWVLPIAWATSLPLVFLLAYVLLRQPDANVRGNKDILLAKVEVKFVKGRGGSPTIPKVELPEVPFKGFLTIVALSPGKPQLPVVFPKLPDDDIAVEPGKIGDSDAFIEDAETATTALVIVTRTPAADSLYKYFVKNKIRFDDRQMNELEKLVPQALHGLNFEEVALTRVKIEHPKTP